MAERLYRALFNVLGPKGIVAPGKTVMLDEADAEGLIALGAVEMAKPEKAKEPEKTKEP